MEETSRFFLSDPTGALLLHCVLAISLSVHGCIVGVLFWKSTGVLLEAVGRLGFFPPAWVQVPRGPGSWPELRSSFVLCCIFSAGLFLAAVHLLYPHAQITALFPGFFAALACLLTLACLLLKKAVWAISPEAAPRRATPLAFAAALLLGLELLLLSALCSLLADPEKWPLLGALPWLLIRPNGFVVFALFLLLSLVILGTATAYFAPPGSRLSGALAVGGLFMLPPALLVDLFTLPEVALSPALFMLLAAMVALSLFGALLAPRFLKGATWSVPVLLGLCLILMFAFSASRVLAMVRALEQAAPGRVMILPKTQSSPTAAPPPASKLMRGEKLFDQICSGCHRWDNRVVGPALSSALIPYRGAPEKLIGFIRDPQKKNPDFPAMPRLGLKEQELADVAAYLLDRLAGNGAGP